MTDFEPWNKDKIVGQMLPLTSEQIWDVRRVLEMEETWRDLALFSVALDSMLRSCDLLALRVSDVCDHNGDVKQIFSFRQKKTKKGVQVELSKYARDTVSVWVRKSGKGVCDFLFTALKGDFSKPISTAQYRKLVKKWVRAVRLNPVEYSSHSLRRSLPSLVFEKTGNIEVVRRLLGQSSVTATSHYLNVDQNKALDIARGFRV